MIPLFSSTVENRRLCPKVVDNAGCQFNFALSKCGLSRDEVVFVGNQLNTDIAGGQEFGIRTVWLCGSAYHSTEETLSPQEVHPTQTIHTLRQLPSLLQRIRDVK
jgi:putative hydrolase of the HAD superfamily